MCNKQRIYVEDIVKMSWEEIEHLEKVVQIGKEEKRKGEEN